MTTKNYYTITNYDHSIIIAARQCDNKKEIFNLIIDFLTIAGLQKWYLIKERA